MKYDRSKIPSVTVNRLSIYYRYLERLIETEEGRNIKTISSYEISKKTGINSSQVRKDLAYFGEFGTRGIGYHIENLIDILKKILKSDKEWNIILAGAGNIGKALAQYEGFRKRGFFIKGIFDNNPRKINEKIDNIHVYDVKDMGKYIRKWHIEIGIIAVPENSAQRVADIMIAGGIKSILNFSPVHIKLSPEIKLKNLDLSVELESLTYYLNL